jgi:hypothetical protein
MRAGRVPMIDGAMSGTVEFEYLEQEEAGDAR